MNDRADDTQAVEQEIQRVVQAAGDAVTDEMVGRLATTLAEAADLIDQINRAELGRAIPALAEMVHNGDLARIVKLARVYGSAEDALTDEMVARLSQAVGDGIALMDQVNRAGLDRAIPALAELVTNGDLARIVKLARVYGSAEDALTDEMVARLAETVGTSLSLLDRFARGGADRVITILEGLESCGALQQIATTIPQLSERVIRIQGMLGAVETAVAATRELPPSRGGVGGLWQMMRDPETQDTLRFLLAVGKELRRGA